MNKKLLAFAVAGATLAPAAMAQTANPVTLYGRMFVMFENVKADGGAAAPVGSRNRVNSNGSSLVGVRGTEDLGGGLKAFFQWETEVRLEQDSPFSNRNSAVGLQGDFGSVLLGRWDTPFKLANASLDPFGDTTLAGYTSAMSDRGNFNRREQNVVQYWSPTWSGFALRASYSANEGKTATVNPVVTSLSATYTQGPIYLSTAWEKHKDIFKSYANYNVITGSGLGAAFNGVANPLSGADETGMSLAGHVTFGAVRVGGLIQKFKKNGGGNTRTSDQKSQMFNIIYTAGKNQFVYQMQRSKDGATRATAATALTEPDTKVNSLGYYYNFSRRTSLIAVYTQTKNNTAGLGNFGANTLTIAANQDPRGFAIGLRHTF
jgi:predicted porin